MSDTPFFIFVSFAIVVFFGFLFAIGYFEYSERMDCLDRGGVMSRAGCLVHFVPAPEQGAQK